MVIGDESLFLGPDLLAWLVLAIGAAMAVGSVAAIVRPPLDDEGNPQVSRSRARSIVFIVGGTVAALWALATLLGG